MGFKESAGAAWRKYRSWPTWVQIVLAIVAVAVVASAAGETGDTTSDDTREDAAETDQTEADDTEQEQARLPEERLRDAVADRLGSSNRDVERISDFGAEQGGRVTIEWAINDNLTEGLTKDSARLDATRILEAVQESGFDYRTVVLLGTFPLVDELGNASEERVVRAQYNRGLVNRINFDNFDFKNVFDIDEATYVHPAFRY